jgi:hypothetical protein
MLRKGKGGLILGLGTTLALNFAAGVTFAQQPCYTPANCAPRYAPATPAYCPPAYGPHTPPSEPPAPPSDLPKSEKPMDPMAPMNPMANAPQVNPDNIFNNQNNVQNQQFNQGAQAQQTTLASRTSSAPNLIGDMFSVSGGHASPIDPDGLIGILPSVYVPTDNLAAAPGANVGRIKLSENVSPIPRDRVYVNYSNFNNTALAGGVDVNRVTPGVEKTFFDGNASIEIRTPFAHTIDSTLGPAAGATPTADSTEFGNMSIYLKAIFAQNESWVISGGLGFALPTASDFVARDAFGDEVLRVDNESVHLLPFLAATYAPNDRFFAQGMVQLDFDPTGNTVYVDGARLGDADDMNYAFVSTSIGYWLFRDTCSDRWITGVAPIAELHYNGSLKQGDDLDGDAGTVFTAPDDIHLLNAVVGLNFMVGQCGSLTLAYATPLTGGDPQFENEFRVLFNWYFGSANRFNRVQF